MSSQPLGITLGAIEIGVFFATVLYGVLSGQVYNYSQHKFKDGVLIRVLVRYTYSSTYVYKALIPLQYQVTGIV